MLLSRCQTLSAAFAGRRKFFVTLLGASAALNVLLLSGALFMLLVYDEVLPSRSTPSLVGLLFIVVIAYGFQAAIEHLRNQMMLNMGDLFDRSLSARTFGLVMEAGGNGAAHAGKGQPVRDLDQLRSFLTGAGPMAILDLPWVLLFLAILFGFHPLLGTVSLVGAIILLALTIVTDRMTRVGVEAATSAANARNAYIEASRRNAEVIKALGMHGRVLDSWSEINARLVGGDDGVAGKIGVMRTASKTFRMFLQSLILACGAWLVINDRASGGVIIASSILSARALAPIELAIGNWRGFIMARLACDRLAERLAAAPARITRTTLPPPERHLTVQNIAAIVPGTQHILFREIAFSLTAGSALAIIGASGSGKSSLARALVGVLPLVRGTIRLDGASIDQWDADRLGQYVGYLPQDIELFDGTISQNIARFDPDADSSEIIGAASAAGIHEMIVEFTDGYDTLIGPSGRNLSAGQRQRIALARALFRDPFLIVLDEPNSNLDAQGDAALNAAIAGAKARGAVVVIVAHRPSALAEIGDLLWLNSGVTKAIGPKQDILPKLTAVPAAPKTANPTNVARPVVEAGAPQ